MSIVIRYKIKKVQKSRKNIFQDSVQFLIVEIFAILHKAFFQHLLHRQMVRAQVPHRGDFRNNLRQTGSVFRLHFRTAVPVRRHFQALQC